MEIEQNINLDLNCDIIITQLYLCNLTLIDNITKNFKLYKKTTLLNNNEFIILYNKYNDNYNINDKEILFRNIKFIKNKINDDYTLVSYNFNNIINVNEANFDINNIYEGFEGTLITLFCIDDIWYYTTSKCIDMFTSKFSSTISHGNMFSDAIYNNFVDFEKILNKSLIYTFVIIHYSNIYLIDYSKRFGEKYAKLLFLWSKNKFMDLDTINNNIDILITSFPNVMKQQFISNYNKNDDVESYINVSFNQINKELIIKRLYNPYIINLKKIKGNFNTEYERLIFSYKNNNLLDYCNIFKKNKIIIKYLYDIFNYSSILFTKLVEYDLTNDTKIKNFKYTNKYISTMKNLISKHKPTIILKFILKNLRVYSKATFLYKLFTEITSHKFYQNDSGLGNIFDFSTFIITINNYNKIMSV